MNSWPDLRPVLRDIPWLVVGGVATRAYMPERATKDLDILVQRADADGVKAQLQAAGYEWVAPLAIPGFLARSPEGVELDVIFGDDVWVEEALRCPQTDIAGYPVIGLPYLVLMKMAAVRAQDMADLSRMLGLASEDQVQQVRDVLQRYAPEAIEDLESLIYLGRLEIEGARDVGA